MTTKRKRWIWGCLIGFVLLGIIAGSEDQDQPENPPTQSQSAIPDEPKPKPKPKPDLELLKGWQYSGGRFNEQITGSIRNNSQHRYKYVQVTFDILDSSGARVGSALGNINGLRPGEIWKFKAVHLGTGGKTARLDDITGW